jgi:hypothetical protein
MTARSHATSIVEDGAGVVRYDVDLAARTFVKMDGTWLFAERKLYVDWLEQRELS